MVVPTLLGLQPRQSFAEIGSRAPQLIRLKEEFPELQPLFRFPSPTALIRPFSGYRGRSPLKKARTRLDSPRRLLDCVHRHLAIWEAFWRGNLRLRIESGTESIS